MKYLKLLAVSVLLALGVPAMALSEEEVEPGIVASATAADEGTSTESSSEGISPAKTESEASSSAPSLPASPQKSNANQSGVSLDEASGMPRSKVTVSEASNWPFVMLTLLGMVACILIIAWLVKRFSGLAGLGGQDLKVVSAVALGTRERIAIVDVKGEQFLIGATPHNISLLHHFDDAPIGQNSSAGKSDFAEKLHKMLRQDASQESLSGDASQK